MDGVNFNERSLAKMFADNFAQTGLRGVDERRIVAAYVTAKLTQKPLELLLNLKPKSTFSIIQQPGCRNLRHAEQLACAVHSKTANNNPVEQHAPPAGHDAAFQRDNSLAIDCKPSRRHIIDDRGPAGPKLKDITILKQNGGNPRLLGQGRLRGKMPPSAMRRDDILRADQLI